MHTKKITFENSDGHRLAALLDLPVDFEKLTEAGSMMGSGGMIVMDDRTCMVDVARYFLEFLLEESCGKCTPCREGNFWMQNLTTRIWEGGGDKTDVELLHNVAKNIQGKCLCALGEFSTMAVVSSIERFSEDFKV